MATDATKVTYVDGHPATITVRRIKVSLMHGGIATEHTFDKDVVTIGAVDGNDIILDDETVSRSHCRIFIDDGAFMIEDLGSRRRG